MENKSQILISDNDTAKNKQKSPSWKGGVEGLNDPNEFICKNETYVAYMMQYIHGSGNAQRLSHIIDEALEKVEIYKKLCECKNSNELKGDFSNSIKKEKREEYNFNNSRYVKIMKTAVPSAINVYLWHMILLGILSIKKSDLNFDFESNETSLIDHCHNSIYNYVISDKFKNKILSFLASENDFCYSSKKKRYHALSDSKLDRARALSNRYIALSDDLYKFYVSLFLEFQNEENLVYETYQIKTLVCFSKVSFYKMVTLRKEFKKEKQNGKLREFVQDWEAFTYSLKSVFYSPQHSIQVRPLALYLYLTGELGDWFQDFQDEFFRYFATVIPFDMMATSRYVPTDKKPFISVPINIFLPYLNKINPIVERYRTLGAENFWKMFFPVEILGFPYERYRNGITLLEDITSYFSSDPMIPLEVLGNLICDIPISNKWLRVNLALEHKALWSKLTGKEIRSFLFDESRQEKINEKKLISYFDTLIICFFEMKLDVKKWHEGGYEKLPNKDKNFIKYVSKIITNTREEDLLKLQKKYDDSNKLVNTDNNDELNQGFIFNDDNDDNDGKACDKILSDSEIKISFDISEEDKNPNQINFINEIKNSKKDNISASDKIKISFDISEEDKNPNKINFIEDTNDKNSKISTNNSSIKTTGDNMNKRSIVDKIKNNLDGEAKPKQEEHSQKSESKWQIF